MPDFRLDDHVSICILTPMTSAAERWVEEHVPTDASGWCGGVVVEHRLIGDVVDGIITDGLTVSEQQGSDDDC